MFCSSEAETIDHLFLNVHVVTCFGLMFINGYLLATFTCYDLFLSNLDENLISETDDPVIYTLLCQLHQVDTLYEKRIERLKNGVYLSLENTTTHADKYLLYQLHISRFVKNIL